MARSVPRREWWLGRRVLVTGHTGFVGGWLCAWLGRLGARVSGYALGPPTDPSFFTATGLAARLDASETGDVNDLDSLSRAVARCDPSVVFHLAAQPLVREAHRDPVATFRTNAMGTVNVLEACRAARGLESVVCYTTDKVYRNDQSGRPFTERDALGGNEPYSASKACAEWVAGAYWESYFARTPRPPALAVVRAGNIVGGGDWAADRLLPDAIRAFSANRALELRSPGSTRPWQHVLDAVRGTLLLAQREHASPVPAEALAWNLGPPGGEVHSVAEVADAAVRAWGEGASWKHVADASIPESRALTLSSERARVELGWSRAWDLERSVAASVAWYRAAARGGDLAAITAAQIDEHVMDASGTAG